MVQECKVELNRSQKEDHENIVEWNNGNNSEHESRILKKKMKYNLKWKILTLRKKSRKQYYSRKPCKIKTIKDWK